MAIVTWLNSESMKYHHRWTSRQKKIVAIIHFSGVSQKVVSKSTHGVITPIIQLARSSTLAVSYFFITLVTIGLLHPHRCCMLLPHVGTMMSQRPYPILVTPPLSGAGLPRPVYAGGGRCNADTACGSNSGGIQELNSLGPLDQHLWGYARCWEGAS